MILLTIPLAITKNNTSKFLQIPSTKDKVSLKVKKDLDSKVKPHFEWEY